MFLYALAVPVIIHLGLVFGYPILEQIYLSFTDARLLERTPPDIVGLRNYQALLVDPDFHQALTNTLLYTVATVTCVIVIAVALAVLLNQQFHGRKFARLLIALPWAFPEVAAVLLWSWMYNKDFGVMNVWARGLPWITENPNWLLDVQTARVSILIISLWQFLPFYTLVLLTALQTIDLELYDAAKIDGAGSVALFRYVSLPGIAPTLGIMTLLITIWSIKRFSTIYLLTGGGPGVSTSTIVIMTYNTAITNQNIGFGAAMGMVGLVISLAVAIFYFGAERRLGFGSS
jgi:multiple sugar transport system permease protein